MSEFDFNHGHKRRQELASNIANSYQNTQDVVQKSENNDLEKGNKMPIGTISNGYKKIAEGKWQKVSEHGLTQKEHKDIAESYIKNDAGKKKDFNLRQIDKHGRLANNLDDKEYDDTHVLGSLQKGEEQQSVEFDFNHAHNHRSLMKSQIHNSFVQEESTTGSISKAEEEDLEKGGKRAVIGEKRTFGGREYIKTSSGWKFHGKGTGTKAQEHVKSSTEKHIGAVTAQESKPKRSKNATDHLVEEDGKHFIDILDPDSGAKKFKPGDKVHYHDDNGKKHSGTISDREHPDGDMYEVDRDTDKSKEEIGKMSISEMKKDIESRRPGTINGGSKSENLDSLKKQLKAAQQKPLFQQDKAKVKELKDKIAKLGNKETSNEFKVYLKGGSIGDKPKDHPQHGNIVKEFDSREEAQAYAERNNKLLTPGEKSYYGMKYHVK